MAFVGKEDSMMSDNPSEIYYDAYSDSGAEESTAKIQVEDHEYEYANSLAIYFELEQTTASDDLSASNDNNSSDEAADVNKMENLKLNLKKINTIVKSKVDVSSRAEIFGGKKRAENPGRGGKAGQKPILPSENGQFNKAEAKHEHKMQIPQETLNTENADVFSSLQHLPTAEEPGAVYSLQHLPTEDPGAVYSLQHLSTEDPGAVYSLQHLPREDPGAVYSLHRLPPEDPGAVYSLQHLPPDGPATLYSLQHLSTDDVAENNHYQVKLSRPRDAEGYDVCDADTNAAAFNSYHVWPGNSVQGEDSESTYEFVKPLPVLSKWTDTLKSTTSSITPSVNKGCLEGIGQAVPVDFLNPHPNKAKEDDKSTEYERLYFKSIDSCSKVNENMREMLKKKGYGSLASIQSDLASLKSEQHLTDEDFDSPAESQSEDEDEISFWGSEFDEVSLQYQDGVTDGRGHYKHEAPDKPLPPKPGKRPFMLRAKSSQSDFLTQEENKYYDPSSTVCLPVTINPEKHPPPVLPPQPSGLTQNQIKRRIIIESIINSERSYLESLERVIKEYEKTVFELISQSQSSVRRVFAEMREITSHHKMFQIELAECVKRWDEEEKIGDIFTASFSKTMLINAYSTYVNNFAASMEEIRTLQRRRQFFRDFLQKQEKLSSDRLSIFGLMVKPVQRFPQFIMFLQDLIKYTPQHHGDRRALQLALTELENVAYRLNERKRQSEQKFQASHTIQQLTKPKFQQNLDSDSRRRLIRTDIVEQVQGEFENLKCKHRRLILMNDLVLCVKVIQKEQSDYTVERLALRWMAKLRDLELKDTAITPDMQSLVKREPGKIHIISSQPEKPEDDPFHLYADLHEMVHDHTVLAQISGLLATLKRSYAGHGLREELVHEVSRDLQRMIQIKEEQLRLVNSCSIILQDNSRADKPNYVLQTQTAAIKQDWCIDFLMAKLAQDRSNNLAWEGTAGTDGSDFDMTPAHFMKHVPVDVPKNYTKIRCAVSIFLNPEKSAYGIGVQHLWVCSSTPTHGQVSVLSVHNSKPALMESFKACASDIMAVELVPGCGELIKANKFLFPEDTVWVATAHKEIFIFPLTSQDVVHRQALAVLRTPAVTASLKFVDERLFCGFDDGAINVYSRKADGSWNVSQPVLLNFGTSSVKLHFVHEENIWLSCGSKLFQLETDSLETKASYELNASHMSPIAEIVKSGVGIWVSFHDSSIIKLFHLETMENLQEISVGNFVNRIRTEKLWTLSGAVDTLVVTCLTVSRGLLWVGTSLGVVLTVPLPRLSDGVPLYRGCPKISLHAHKGPVRFLIPMHCSSNILELNRASSLRSTLRARQSRRNLEREKLELEESQKRKERMKNTESSDVLNVISHGTVSESEDELSNNLPVSSISGDSKALVKGESEVQLSKISWSNIDVQNKYFQTSASNNDSRSEIHRKSKTISFRTELAQRILVKSSSLSKSDLNLSNLESHEVEELYEILLEEEADIEVGNINAEYANNTSASVATGSHWSTGNKAPATSMGSSSNLVIPTWLNKTPPIQAKQNNANEGKAVGAQPLSPQVRGTSPVASTSSTVNNLNIIPGNVSLSPSPIIGFARGRTSRMNTLRKATCNAIIVVSGGDGYCDLDLSRNQSKMDEACTLLWVHKF